MVKGRTYRHMSCIDMDLHVLTVQYRGPDYIVIKPVWVNRYNGYLFPDSAKRVRNEDLWKWSMVLPSDTGDKAK